MGDAYFGFLAEAEPGESHELALAVGELVLGVDSGSHAGRGLVDASGRGRQADAYLTGVVWMSGCQWVRVGEDVDKVLKMWSGCGSALSQCFDCHNVECAARKV